MVALRNLTCLPDYQTILVQLSAFLIFSFSGLQTAAADYSPFYSDDIPGEVEESFSRMHYHAKKEGKFLAVFFFDVMSSRSREVEKMLYSKYRYDKDFNGSVLLMRRNGFAISGEAKDLKEAFYISKLPALLVLDENRQVVRKFEGVFGEESVDKLLGKEEMKKDVIFSWQVPLEDSLKRKVYRTMDIPPDTSGLFMNKPARRFFPTKHKVANIRKEGFNNPQYGLIIETGLSWDECVEHTSAWLLLWSSHIWVKYESEGTYTLILGGADKKKDVKTFQKRLRNYDLPSTVTVFAPDVYHYRRLF